jgi:cob(I)alamin adenosyltransferase
MSIYTKKGDKGKTSTFVGKKVSKSSKLIFAIGAIDELNSFLGMANTGYKDIKILSVQRDLFTINAILAGAKLEFPVDATRRLEREIDQIEGTLPVQKNFIIYGGTKKATQLFFARALCRHAERELSTLKRVEAAVRMYVNRLSDYLFIKAREENFKKGIKEPIWKPARAK